MKTHTEVRLAQSSVRARHSQEGLRGEEIKLRDGGRTRGTPPPGQKARRAYILHLPKALWIKPILQTIVLCVFFFFFFCLFVVVVAISWAAPTAYGGSQARG